MSTSFTVIRDTKCEHAAMMAEEAVAALGLGEKRSVQCYTVMYGGRPVASISLYSDGELRIDVDTARLLDVVKKIVAATKGGNGPDVILVGGESEPRKEEDKNGGGA